MTISEAQQLREEIVNKINALSEQGIYDETLIAEAERLDKLINN